MADHLKAWRLSAGDEQTVFDETGAKLVSVSCGGLSGRTFDEAADVARLIAAAPELLEALEKARNTLAGCGMAKIADDICAAAISKARGQ